MTNTKCQIKLKIQSSNFDIESLGFDLTFDIRILGLKCDDL